MFQKTPLEFRDRARSIDVKLKTRTPKGRYVYNTYTRDNGNTHKQWIKPLKPNRTNMHHDAVVWCDCGNFTFENEYVLWKKNSSNLVNSNGNPPVIRNPKRVPKLCKHLVAVMDDYERRV
jgi:hypothetical protein